MFAFLTIPKTLIKSASASNVKCTNLLLCRLLNYVSHEYGHDRDPAPLFFNSEVQSLLKTLTRVDLNRVFKKRKLGDKRLQKPIYKFMTTEELESTLQEAQRKADELLQMPPVVAIRKPIEAILKKDPALTGLDNSKHVFTDITFGLKDSERMIVVRETDGTLRHADWETRDRMNQIYFPKSCRYLRIPRMFEGEYLENLLNQKEYEFVLDRTCVQFEPDQPNYQRVTSITYQHINDHDGFEKLRSTRHFGPLAFYLVWCKNIDKLLLELLETTYIEEVNSLLKLYEKIHETDFKIKDLHGTDGITQYIKEAAQLKGALELALQAYKDFEKEKKELQAGIKSAHGL